MRKCAIKSLTSVVAGGGVGAVGFVAGLARGVAEEGSVKDAECAMMTPLPWLVTNSVRALRGLLAVGNTKPDWAAGGAAAAAGLLVAAGAVDCWAWREPLW